MESRLRSALRIAGALLVACGLIVAGGFLFFSLAFGSADHTQFTLTAEAVSRDRIARNATASLSSREAAVVDEAHRNGSARTVAGPLDVDGAYVERNGTYYRVRVESGPDVTRERPVLTIEEATDTGDEVVLPDELPAADERAFLAVWRAWNVRNADRGGGEPPVRYVYETVPDPADSVFVPERSVRYVRYENRTFEVHVRYENRSLDTTAYRLEPVAENESAFVEAVVFNASGRLNDSAAEPLDRAVAEGSYVSRARESEAAARPIRPVAAALGFDDPSAFLFEQDRAVRYVRYEGRFYRVTLSGHTTAA